MHTFDLIVVGEMNADLILRGDVTPTYGQVEKLLDDATLTIGSSGCIFACGAARLGLRVAYVGKVGDDHFGRFMLAALNERGVDVGGVVIDPTRKTGLTVVLARGQDRALLTHLGAINALRYDEIDLSLLARARHLHIGSYFLLDALKPAAARLFAKAREMGLTTSLDTNYDPSERWQDGIDNLLSETDIFLPNETELCGITGIDDVEKALHHIVGQVPTVAVKLGARGAMARRGEQRATADVLPVTVVDATGAGDSFDAGFVYGFLAGWPLDRTLRIAAACGSLSTRGVGGTSAQPTLEEALAAIGPDHALSL